MVKFMRDEMTLLSDYLVSRYDIDVITPTKKFSVIPIFNAMEDISDLAKLQKFEELCKFHKDIFKFLTYQDSEGMNTPILGIQIEAIFNSVQQEKLEFNGSDYVELVSSPVLYAVIEKYYRDASHENKIFIPDDVLTKNVNYLFTYYMLEAFFALCIKFLTEYISNIGPGTESGDSVTKRSYIKKRRIIHWFDRQCKKLARIENLIMEYEKIVDMNDEMLDVK